jgi:hypothetical protein
MSAQNPPRFDDDYVWECYNNLLLSHDVERVRKLMVRYDLFRMSLDVPGDIIECGVFKGTGMMFWLKLTAIFAAGSRKQVVGFDTFGEFASDLLPYEQVTADAYVQEAISEPNDPVVIMKRAADAGLADMAEIVEGQLESTAGQYVKDNPGFRVSLLHLDLDTYSGTKAALEAFYPVVSKSGVIILDEYACRGWGESDAVDEYFSDKDVQIKTVPFGAQPTAYVVKPR